MNAEFKLNGKILETERLVLRPFNEEDLDNLYEYAKVPGVGEMAGWAHHESKEVSIQILNMFIKEDKTFAIVYKENNKVIGSLGVENVTEEGTYNDFDALKGREIGYALSKDYWGKGLMPEAVRCVINYLFDELDLDYLTCGYYEFNSQSSRVQEKCGFKPYRKHEFVTRMGTKVNGMLNVLFNPKKNLKIEFHHQEDLLYK